MSMVWKLLIALGLLLPGGAFVAGMLVASTAEPQAPRETIVIQDADAGARLVHAGTERRPKRSSAPSPSTPSPTGDGVADPDADDGDDDTGGGHHPASRRPRRRRGRPGSRR